MNLLVILILVSVALGQEDCSSKAVIEGKCIRVAHCPTLETILPTIPIVTFFEKYDNCSNVKYFQNIGYYRFCCPEDDCVSPKFEHGKCRLLSACPELNRATKTETYHEFVNNYVTCKGRQYKGRVVCCPNVPTIKEKENIIL